MAAATGGEPATLETFADVCCTLMLACELAGDEERPKQWSRVFEEFAREYDHVPLLAFCRTCGGDVSAANGRIDDAEEELTDVLRELTAAGQSARCVHLSPSCVPVLIARQKTEVFRVADGIISYWCQVDVAGMVRQLEQVGAVAELMS